MNLYIKYVCVLSMTLSLCASEKLSKEVTKMRYVNGAARDELSDLGWELVDAEQKQLASAQDKIPRIYQNIPEQVTMQWLEILNGLKSEQAQMDIRKYALPLLRDNSIESVFAAHTQYVRGLVQQDLYKDNDRVLSIVVSSQRPVKNFSLLSKIMCPTEKHTKIFDALLPLFIALDSDHAKAFKKDRAQEAILHVIHNGLLAPYLLASSSE